MKLSNHTTIEESGNLNPVIDPESLTSLALTLHKDIAEFKKILAQAQALINPKGYMHVTALAELYQVNRATMDAFIRRNNLTPRIFSNSCKRYSVNEVEAALTSGASFEYEPI